MLVRNKETFEKPVATWVCIYTKNLCLLVGWIEPTEHQYERAC